MSFSRKAFGTVGGGLAETWRRSDADEQDPNRE